jgi:predicted lipoprotein with Yx(FWY)xxD motif
MRNRWWIGPGLAAAAMVLAACGTSGTGTDPAATAAAAGHSDTGADPVAVKTMSTRKGTVLVNAEGRTLYWFAKDTSTKSRCNGSCATYWPPVLGKATATAATSLPHGFGTIKRTDGKAQVTYDGHPLYTYSGDTAAGQLNGNGLNASGGLWWAITPSGSELTAKTTSSSSGSGSSGSNSGGGGW